MVKDKKMHMTKCPLSDNCIPQEITIRNVRLAAAYVPYQQMCNLLDPMEALAYGTIFPELYSPYEGKDKKCKPFPTY